MDPLIHDWNEPADGTAERPNPAPMLDDETLRDGLQSPSVLDPPIEVKIDLLHRCEERIFAVLDGLGGSISAEHGIGRLKRHAFLDRISPVHRDLLGAIKHAFDPAGILNPGRILEQRAP